jgi:hypothetical protein
MRLNHRRLCQIFWQPQQFEYCNLFKQFKAVEKPLFQSLRRMSEGDAPA